VIQEDSYIIYVMGISEEDFKEYGHVGWGICVTIRVQICAVSVPGSWAAAALVIREDITLAEGEEGQEHHKWDQWLRLHVNLLMEEVQLGLLNETESCFN